MSRAHMMIHGLCVLALCGLTMLVTATAGPAATSDLGCVPPPSGLTGWWPGDRSLVDIVGGSTAVLEGNASYARGLVRHAFDLDGDGDFVNVPASSALDVGEGDFTVDLWVKFNTTEGEQVLIEKWVQSFDTPATGWTLTKLENNVIRLALGPQSGVGDFNVDSHPIPLPADRWLHFAARRSGREFTVFLMGFRIAAGVIDEGSVFDLNSTSSLKFGHRGNSQDTPGSQDDSGFFLNGLVDEVELAVGRALSTSEIRAIVFAGPDGKCKK